MYAKVFSQIFDSSIAEDYQTRHVFMDLLVLADRFGVVDMTIEAISRRINVPLDIVTAAVCKLCKPDVNSRSANDDGRRLVLLDAHRNWGWRIVNFEAYHAIRDENARREYMRSYMRDKREKEKACKHPVNSVNFCKHSLAHIDVDVDEDEDKQQRHPNGDEQSWAAGDVQTPQSTQTTSEAEKRDGAACPAQQTASQHITDANRLHEATRTAMDWLSVNDPRSAMRDAEPFAKLIMAVGLNDAIDYVARAKNSPGAGKPYHYALGIQTNEAIERNADQKRKAEMKSEVNKWMNLMSRKAKP